MKPYPTYKDSGIAWIGEIPAHWENWKVSHAYENIGSGTTPKTDNRSYYSSGEIPWINTGDLNDGILYESSKKITEKALEDYSTLKVYKPDSLVIAMYGATIGKVSITAFEATVNQACCVLSESKIIEIRFLFYWFQANKRHVIGLSVGGGQPNISQEIIKSLRVPVPEFFDQKEISSFLDSKTAQIDAAIEKHQQLIALLQEERQALINEAVTRGLDPKVPMKDSGIEWIGEIPAHWEVKKIKHVAIINPQKGSAGFEKSSEELAVFLPMEQVSENGEIDCSIKKPISQLYSGFTYFEKRDVILAKITPCFENGKAALLNNLETKVGFGSTEFHVFRALESIRPEFLFLLLRTHSFMKIGEAFMTGSAGQKRVPTAFIEEYFFGLPETEEQDQIIEFIDSRTSELDSEIRYRQNEISLLQEYRQALITEAVTGKIDVRDHALS